jgi:hypothetical protein
MVIFTKENFIERCRDVLDDTFILTPKNLVEQLRKSVRKAAGLEPGGGLDPIEAEKYSRMESHLLDIIRIIEAHSNEKFDIRAVINEELINKEVIDEKV